MKAVFKEQRKKKKISESFQSETAFPTVIFKDWVGVIAGC